MRAALHDVIHSPVRLQVCAHLDRTGGARFADVQAELGITDSHLSKNVRILVEADLVEQSKMADESGSSARPVTFLSLTPRGRTAYSAHIAWLEEITRHSRNDPATGSPQKGDKT